MANGQIDPFGTIAICSVMTRTALDPKRKFRAATTIDSGRCEGLFRANGARLSLPWRQNNHSGPACPPFSATERFINNTANVTTNVNTAAIQKVSKYASEDACC
jgi:hypothetical protein